MPTTRPTPGPTPSPTTSRPTPSPTPKPTRVPTQAPTGVYTRKERSAANAAKQDLKFAGRRNGPGTKQLNFNRGNNRQLVGKEPEEIEVEQEVEQAVVEESSS